MRTKKVKNKGKGQMLVALFLCGLKLVPKTLFKRKDKHFSIIKRQVLAFYALLLTTIVTAQIYPVQVNPQLIPPYSLKLSDYQTTASEKLFVNLLLTDVSELGRQVRLKMYIEGEGLNIQTLDFVAGANPISLDGGVNQRLSNLDIRSYFNLNNLLGVTPQQYSSALPEGRYDFCFEVYDFISGQQLSRKSCFSAFLILNEPPILNIPGNSDLVTAKEPQNIIFNWTPRHLNATNVQYEYTLKELWDTEIDPQAAFLVSPPLHQETTFATTILYGPANTQLLEGKTYAWQVRALVSDGISETSVFRNDGFSEVYSFNYQGDCDAPAFVISEATNSKTVKITWNYSDHLRYHAQYRKEGYGDDDWFSVYAYNQETTVQNLEPGTTYEFRVGGECTTNGGFVYSQISQFTTPTDEEDAYYNCGVLPEINIENQEPLLNIGTNEVFTAGDFPVTVKEVNGSNGVYSGWGFITIPYLGDTKIRVEFKNASLNTDYQLIDGIVETSYDENWGGIASIDEAIENITGADGVITTFDATDIVIAEVVVNAAGGITIIDENGNEIPIEIDKPVVINGANNQQFTVNEDGTVTEGTAAEGGAPTNESTNGIANNGDVTQISSADVTVVFKASGFYGTDALREDIDDNKFTKHYETIPQASGGNYNVLYKTVSNITPNTTDFIEADVSFSNNKTKDDIIFKTKQGTAIEATWSGNTATINLKKEYSFGKDEILAVVKPADSTGKYDVAGKLDVWHLEQKEINVTIVPVGNATVTDAIKAEVNAIYNPVGVHFNITVAPKFTINQTDWDVENGNGKLDIGDSNTLANYTVEERAIYNKYNETNSVVGQMYYMFVLGSDIPTTDATIKGFMPLKRQYGFAFNPTSASRTVAHELGHGIFGLEHPFTEYNNAEGTTDLLMDYKGGTTFTNMDWQKMHAPGLEFYFFQSDEDGESVSTSLDKTLAINEKKYNCESGNCEANNNGKYYFGYLTPAGERIVLSEEYKPIFYHGISDDKYNKVIPGTLIGFETQTLDDNGKVKSTEHWAEIEGTELKGYKDFSYSAPKITDDDNKSIIIGLPYGNTDEKLLWKNYKFKELNRNDYTGESKSIVDITTDDFKQMGLFKNHVPFKEKVYNDTSKITGEGQIAITKQEIKLLSGYYNEDISAFFKDVFDLSNRASYQISHNDRREVFLIIKIAEIYNRYPHLFEGYTKFFDNWDLRGFSDMSLYYGKWDKENISYPLGADFNIWYDNFKMTSNSSENNLNQLYDFYQKFLKDLLEYVSKGAVENAACLASDFEFKTGKEIFECIQKASEYEIKDISLAKKIVAIKKILEIPIVGNEIKDDHEIEVARILQAISNGNISNFDDALNFFEKTEVEYRYIHAVDSSGNADEKLSIVPLWYALFNNIEDQIFIFGENNRQSIVKSLGKIFMQAEGEDGFVGQLKKSIDPIKLRDAMTVGDLKDLHNYFYSFENDYQNIFRRGWSDVAANNGTIGLSLYDTEDFYKSVDTDINSSTFLINTEQKVKWGLFNNTVLKAEELSPFQLVSFINISKNNLLKPFTAKDEKGNPQAIFVPALTMHYASKTDQLQTQSDIIQTSIDLLTFLPSGGVTALNGFGKFVYYADKISGVSSIASTAFRETNPDLSKYMGQLSLVSGVASLGSLSSLVKKDILLKKDNLEDLLVQGLGDIMHPNALDDLNNPVENLNELAGTIVSGTVGDFDISKLTPDQITSSKKIIEKEFKNLKGFSDLNVGKIENALLKLDEFAIPNVSVLPSSVVDASLASKEKVKNFLSEFNKKHTDGFTDIIIHGADNKFILDLPGGIQELETSKLVDYLKTDSDFEGVRNFRLLSCSDMKLAEELVGLLPEGSKVRATDDIVRIHGDGGVTTVPRGADNPPNEWQDLTLNSDGTVKRTTAASPDLASPEFLTDFVELGRRSKTEQFLTTLKGGGYPEIWNRLDGLNLSNDDLLRFATDFKDATKEDLITLGNNNGELVNVWKKWGDPNNELVKLSKTRISSVDDLAAYSRVYNREERLITFDDFFEKTRYQIKEVVDIKKENYKKFAVELFEAWDKGYKNNKSIAEMQAVYVKYGLKVEEAYPPNEGVWGLIERRAPTKDEIFDRFQSRESLGGGYAGSLSEADIIPTISARALKENYSDIVKNGEDYFYFVFKMDNVPDDLKFEFGEAMPWFGEAGGATQIKSSKALHELTGDINFLEKWKLVDGVWKQDFSILKNKFPENVRSIFDDASESFFTKLETLNKEGKLEKFIDDFKGNSDALTKLKNNEVLIDSWNLLDGIESSLRGDIVAIEKIDFLKSKGLSDVQLNNIGGLNDIKAIDLAEALAKRSSPYLNDLDKVSEYAVRLNSYKEGALQTLIDMAKHEGLLNPEVLLDFAKNSSINSTEGAKKGWKYELDVFNDVFKNNQSISFSFSKYVPAISGNPPIKEVDFIGGGKLIEVKTWDNLNTQPGNIVLMGLLDKLGKQVKKIDFTDPINAGITKRIGRGKILTEGHPTYNMDRDGLKAVLRETYTSVGQNLDELTELVIENGRGKFVFHVNDWKLN